MEGTSSIRNWLDAVPQHQKQPGSAGPAEVLGRSYPQQHSVIISEDDGSSVCGSGGERDDPLLRSQRVSFGSNGSGDPRRVLFQKTSVSLGNDLLLHMLPAASHRLQLKQVDLG